MILGDVKLPNLRGVNRGLQILLVEDDDDDAVLIETVLQADKRVSEIWRCRDGLEASEFLDGATRPDLVIADVNMPRKDGFAFLRDVRASKNGKSLPVAIMTSSAHATDYHASLLARANTFITKPDSYDELEATLKRLIRAFIWEDALPPLFAVADQPQGPQSTAPAH